MSNIAFFGASEAFLSAHLGGDYLPLTKSEIEASSMQVKEGRDGVPGLQATTAPALSLACLATRNGFDALRSPCTLVLIG